jgi:hypothetical protein
MEMVRHNNHLASYSQLNPAFIDPTITKTVALEPNVCEEGIVYQNSSTNRHPFYQLQVDPQGDIYLTDIRNGNLSIFSETR